MGKDMLICNLGIMRGTFASGSILLVPQMSLPSCPPLNKITHHFFSFQVSFLLIPEAFTYLTPSHQSKLLMEFGLEEGGVGREVDCFREENYSLLSPITAPCFTLGKNTSYLKEIILVSKK